MAILYLWLTLVAGAEKQMGENPVILGGSSDPSAVNFIYFTSPLGIYVFDRKTQTWGRINQANGLPDNRIDIIGLDEGILWVGTPKGIASADVRINDWQTHELPGPVQGLAFDDQYVWVGGGFGLKRFDKYSETWQDLSDRPVRDLASDRDYVWICGDSGITRYIRKYEKIEEVPAAPRRAFQRIVQTPNRTWFLADDGFAACQKTGEVWSEYPGLPVTGLSSLGDSLYVAAAGRIYYFEPRVDNWLDFRDIEGLDNAVNVFVNAQNLLCATDDGLIVYNWQSRRGKPYNRSNGLERDSLIGVYQQANLTFCVSRGDIEFLDSLTGIWQIEKFKPSGALREKVFYLDEAGGHARLGLDFECRLQGRAFLSYTGARTDSLDRNEIINLKLIGQHRSNRMFSLYYDDTDKSDTVYGGGYRGRDRDLLYRLDGGFLKSEWFELDMIPSYYNRGANAKLQAGPALIDIHAGQLKSAVRNDFFTGRTAKKSTRLFDTYFQKYVFYYADSLPLPWARDFDTIFIDDNNPVSNTPATRTGYTIAGLTGDFDPLLNGRDYFIDYRRGLIHFLAPRAPGEWIVLLINGKALVLQSPSFPGHPAENIYFLGLNIIPSTFAMDVEDTAGRAHPLAEFGLDQDGDGRVDPEFINYDLGLLTFPDPHPFPDTVHVYSFDIGYESYSNFYFLTENPVLIGSEKVVVDGDQKTRGTDYIVDYTSGILLFMRPDIVSDFSEIQVQYEQRQRARTDWYFSGQPVVVVGSHLKVSPGFTRLENHNLLHGSGEIKAGAEEGEFNIRLTPQATLDENGEWAQVHRIVGRYRGLNMNAEYRGYSPAFNALGLEQGRYGRLRNLAAVAARIESMTMIQIEGGYRREDRIDSTETPCSARYLSGKVGYLHPHLVNGYLAVGRNYLPDYGKDIIQLGANYEAEKFGARAKINGALRNDNLRLALGDRERDFDYLFNANIGLPVPVQANGYFERNYVYARGRLSRVEQTVRGLANIDLIPGLYYLTNYSLQQNLQCLTETRDLARVSSFYNNLNVAPGRWFLPLSVVNFSFGTGAGRDEYLEDLDPDFPMPGPVFPPAQNENISRCDILDSYYGAVQFNPTAGVALWVRHTLNQNGLGYYGSPVLRSYSLDEIKAEYEPKRAGYFMVYGYRRIDAGIPRETVDNLYGEWDKPWSGRLRTKLSADCRMRRDDYYPNLTRDSEWKSVGETLLRFGANSFITFKLGGRRQSAADGAGSYSLLPGAGFNLSLFTFLSLQFNWDAAVVLDSTTTQAGSLKITGQF